MTKEQLSKIEEQIKEVFGKHIGQKIAGYEEKLGIKQEAFFQELSNLLTKSNEEAFIQGSEFAYKHQMKLAEDLIRETSFNEGYLLGLKEGTELNVTQSAQSETLSAQSETLSKECITSDTNEIKRKAVRGFAEHLSKNARKSEGHSLAEDGVAPFLMIDAAELYYLVEAYLTQQSLAGGEE